MRNSARWGLVLILVGVMVNNYSYLKDIIVGDQGGMIYLGWHAVAGVVVSLMVIAIGVWLTVRRPVPR
jgi:hypothetical protein